MTMPSHGPTIHEAAPPELRALLSAREQAVETPVAKEAGMHCSDGVIHSNMHVVNMQGAATL